MSTTLDAIYEHGIFRPVAGMPDSLKDKERVKITIETDDEYNLNAEFREWDAASDEDMLTFERKLEEIGYSRSII